MAEQHDIELAEDASAATDHGGKKEVASVAVKWYFNGNWRRFQCAPWTFDTLMAEIRAIEPNFGGRLFYRDADQDAIVFSTDAEMRLMLTYFRNKLQKDTVSLETKVDVEHRPPPYTANLEVPPPISDDHNKFPHPGVICDVCDGPVVGVRYKCFVCPDFDLCEQCEKTGVHAEHAMCRLGTVDTPRPSGLRQCPWSSMFPRANGPYLLPSYEHHPRLVAKCERAERHFAKRVARREQHLQSMKDRLARMEQMVVANKTTSSRSTATTTTPCVKPTAMPSAPPPATSTANVQQSQQKTANNANDNKGVGHGQHGRRVDYLMGIGQSVQHALKNFGIECDAEVRDERGVLHGTVPFHRRPTENNNSSSSNGTTQQQHKEKPNKKIHTKNPILVHEPPFANVGILQRRQLCTDSSRTANPPNSANSSAATNTPSAPSPQLLPPLPTFSSLPGPLPVIPPMPVLSGVDKAALMATLTRAQETLKKSLPGALFGLEAATTLVGQLFAGFDANTGQAANRVGQSVVDAARQGVEDLDRFLSPEFIAQMLQQQTDISSTVRSPPNAAQTDDGKPKDAAKSSENDGKPKNVGEKSEEVSANDHMTTAANLPEPNPVVVEGQQQQMNAGGGAVDELFEEKLQKLKQNQQKLETLLDEMRLTDQAAEMEKLLPFFGVNSTGKQQTSPVQLGNKRKLADCTIGENNGEDLMKLSTHNSSNNNGSEKSLDGHDQPEELVQLSANANTAETDELDMHSVSSRSSSTSTSSDASLVSVPAEDVDSTWMVVKKESFKKLCDFYEKRRRVESNGGTVAADPFSDQLEREFREAMKAADAELDDDDESNKTAPVPVPSAPTMQSSAEDGSVESQMDDDAIVVVEPPTAAVEEAQIVDLGCTDNNDSSEKSAKEVGCVHAVVMRGVCAACGQDFRQPNELVGHSATILGLQQHSKPADNVAAASHPIGGQPQQQQRLYPMLDSSDQDLKKCADAAEVCTAGLPFPGYQKPMGQKHRRQCEWKHDNFMVQDLVDQLVEMGFDNCNGWLFRVVEQNGREMDRVFAAIDADPMYRARVSLE